jgi:hypothetical protein
MTSLDLMGTPKYRSVIRRSTALSAHIRVAMNSDPYYVAVSTAGGSIKRSNNRSSEHEQDGASHHHP